MFDAIQSKFNGQHAVFCNQSYFCMELFQESVAVCKKMHSSKNTTPCLEIYLFTVNMQNSCKFQNASYNKQASSHDHVNCFVSQVLKTGILS